MKNYTRIGLYSRFGLLPLLLILLSLISYSQEIVSRDGSSFLKLDLTKYSSFSNTLIVSELDQLQNAKVIVSPEAHTIYVYPYDIELSDLHDQVKAIISSSVTKDLNYSNAEKELVTKELKDTYGDRLLDYSKSGILETYNDSCHLSMPFCTGTIYSFPAGTNTQSQNGPNYNCLSTQPNPAWYHLKIENPGPIAIYMFSTPSRDIDFCLWGPFTDPITPCPMTNTNGGLTANKVVDCSYSPNPTETANIPNGQTGQYYILIITNYSNQQCNVTFQQNSGTGTTDCTILPPAATSNSPVCVNETIELHAANAPGATYNWSGPNNFMSTQQNPTILNAQFINAGVYSLTITVQGITSDPTNTEIFVYDPPTASLTANGNTTICEGDSVQLTIAATSVGPFRAVLSSGNGIPTIINFWQSSTTFWIYPSDTTTFTLTGISNNACSGTVSGAVTVNVKPKPVPLFSSSNPCANLITQFTDQSTVTGGSVSSWDWNFGDLTPHSNLPNPTHSYTNANNYNVTLSVTANNGCSKSASFPVLISPTPSVSAGSDVSIPYGTNTQLNGSASGGSGTHTYQWIPADKVVSPTILNPSTILLASSVDFTLTALDANGCQKSDEMKVTITGGPLSGLITAAEPEICIGESMLLNAVPSGGSGIYSCTWTSNPPGFTSNLEDVTVSPTVTTTYLLSVYDNFNTINAQFTLTVNARPNVNAGTDQTIPHGTNTTLSAAVTGGNSPYQYAWTPANILNSPTNATTQTHNLYSSTSFNLAVTDSKGCDQTDEMTVSIEGGPLQVNPIAMQPVICRYESTQIKALPAGGDNTYDSYSWTSVPAGFTSNAAEPTVTPDVTTVYTVVVDDGYNTTSGSVTVTVNQLPVIDLIPDDPRVLVMSPTEIGLCVFDSIPIDAGNPGAAYEWSNGSTEQVITVATSGISFDQQAYSVIVTDPTTLCSKTANITAYFNFENCSYGIEEKEMDSRFKVYPNPSSTGVFNMLMEDLSGTTMLQVFNAYGSLIWSNSYKLNGGVAVREELNLSSAPNGVYLLKLMNNEAAIIKKIIIR